MLLNQETLNSTALNSLQATPVTIQVGSVSADATLVGNAIYGTLSLVNKSSSLAASLAGDNQVTSSFLLPLATGVGQGFAPDLILGVSKTAGFRSGTGVNFKLTAQRGQNAQMGTRLAGQGSRYALTLTIPVTVTLGATRSGFGTGYQEKTEAGYQANVLAPVAGVGTSYPLDASVNQGIVLQNFSTTIQSSIVGSVLVTQVLVRPDPLVLSVQANSANTTLATLKFVGQTVGVASSSTYTGLRLTTVTLASRAAVAHGSVVPSKVVMTSQTIQGNSVSVASSTALGKVLNGTLTLNKNTSVESSINGALLLPTFSWTPTSQPQIASSLPDVKVIYGTATVRKNRTVTTNINVFGNNIEIIGPVIIKDLATSVAASLEQNPTGTIKVTALTVASQPVVSLGAVSFGTLTLTPSSQPTATASIDGHLFFPTVTYNVGPVQAVASTQATSVGYGTVSVSGSVEVVGMAVSPFVRVDQNEFGIQRRKIYRENVASGGYALKGINNVTYSVRLTKEMVNLQNLGFIDIAGYVDLNLFFAPQLVTVGADNLVGPIPPAQMTNIQQILNALVDTYNSVSTDLINLRKVVADIRQEIEDVNSEMLAKYGLEAATYLLKNVSFAPADYFGNSPPLNAIYAVEDTPPYVN